MKKLQKKYIASALVYILCFIALFLCHCSKKIDTVAHQYPGQIIEISKMTSSEDYNILPSGTLAFCEEKARINFEQFQGRI